MTPATGIHCSEEGHGLQCGILIARIEGWLDYSIRKFSLTAMVQQFANEGSPKRLSQQKAGHQNNGGASAGAWPRGKLSLSDELIAAIQSHTTAILPEIIETRRYLHRNPELSGQEYQTTAFLARQVEALGLQPVVPPERTGLTCDFVFNPTAGQAPDRLVIRGDIDALPITDAKMVDYRSACDGVMHACGHDVHPAIVLGALKVLALLAREAKVPWPIAVRGLFQPAEETATGATAMIHSHALRDVSAAIALHVDPTRTVGQIGIRAETLTASCDTFQIDFEGRGGHGARPHLANDPIEAAATWITTALRRVPRCVDAQDPVVISVGIIQAGQASNVIPDTAMLQGTLRTLTKSVRRDALEAIEDINESISKQFGVKVRIHLSQSAPPVENDSKLSMLLGAVAERVLCAGCVDWIKRPSMGSEDFSYYLEHVPGVMFRLGVAGEQVGHAPLHTPQFDIDERALGVGVRLMVAMALEYFSPSSGFSY